MRPERCGSMLVLVLIVAGLTWCGCAGRCAPAFAVPAAPSTAPRVDGPLDDHQRLVHFLDRGGYGARFGQVEEVERLGLFMYLQQQLDPETIDDRQTEARLRAFKSLRVPPGQMRQRYPDPGDVAKMKKEKPNDPPSYFGDSNALLAEMQQQRLVRAVHSRRQVLEVMVDFFMNHFNIYYHKSSDKWLLLAFERDTIRPRALGRFRDLLGAVAHSPAMLVYLDNSVSRAEAPARSGAKKQGGLNENYARELLELHTLGVDGGYTQRDVVEVARCFTGWTIDKNLAFTFRKDWHDNGEKVVLGHTIPAGGGVNDGEMVLDIVAAHPSTARFLAKKLCRELIGDDPPVDAIDQVARSFSRSDGDTRRAIATLFNTAAFWSRKAWRAKVKTPFHLVVSALRAVDGDLQNAQVLNQQLQQMGMPLYLCVPPTGYIDRAENWLSAGSLLARLNLCVALAQDQIRGVKVDITRLFKGLPPQASKPPAVALDVRVQRLLDHAVLYREMSDATRGSVLQALNTKKPDYRQLLGLLLGSPEFQRR
ncbi:MAG: DUF1800 domain-containing protein [Proteobacteria bacterium]|nr:DUF1800 domain-containing protein [Pseudomonadota bacterium]